MNSYAYCSAVVKHDELQENYGAKVNVTQRSETYLKGQVFIFQRPLRVTALFDLISGNECKVLVVRLFLI